MKKILVFSHNPFSNILNNGKTLKNIFSMFNKDYLSQFYIDQENKPDFTICDNYFTISDKEIIESFFQRKTDIGTIINKYQVYDEKNLKSRKTKLPLKTEFTKLIRNFFWEHSNWHSNKLQNWIRKNNPDILFFVGGSYTFSHKIALKISKYYKLPLVTYFTDDYIINYSNNSLLGKIYEKKLLKSYNNTISNSKLLFVIGELMSRDYSTLFNRKFDYIMNCVQDIPKSLNENSNSINISYFGGLHLKRYESLMEFAETMKKLDLKFKYTISVYTTSDLPIKILNQLKSKGVSFFNIVEGEELQNAINNSNFLLHLESHDKKIKKLIKYSISTKIPEYLISSRMIICYGPSDVASMKLIEDNGIGLVLDKYNINFSKKLNMLKECLSNIEEANKLANKGYLYAKENYTIDIVAKKFYSTLNSI